MRNFNLKDFTLNWMGRGDQFRSKSRGTFWPSEARAEFTNANGHQEVLGKCMRASYYRLTGAPLTNPPSAKSQVIFHLGNQIEDGIVEIWKQAGIWDNNSVRFEDRDKNISGEFDCVLRDPTVELIGLPKFGAEVKTFYGYMQEKTILGHSEGRGARKHWVWGKPKDENLMQAAIYCDQTRDTLSGFKLYYISRDKNDMAEFNISVDDNGTIFIHDPKRGGAPLPETRFAMNDIYDSWTDLKGFIERGEIPARDFDFRPSQEKIEEMYGLGEISKSAYEKHNSGKIPYRDWHCSYCSYRDHCQGPEAAAERIVDPEETEEDVA